VTVSTPDHSHGAAAMMALKMGKHVYCQKPLARTIGEVRALKARRRKRPKQVTQMGNQGHAAEGIRQIREWVEAGLIGTVQRVEYWTNRPIWPQAINRPTDGAQRPADARLEPLARPRRGAAVHPGVRAVQLARLVGLRHRRDGRHGLPHHGRRRTGRSASSIRRASRPRARLLFCETAPAWSASRMSSRRSGTGRR
jgi:hypothetical protein